jgi:pimeloyl-ACP methyl ester carboxylesterase
VSILDLPTGVRLDYAEQGPADGEAFLFLHGYTDSRVSWSRVLPLLPPTVRAVALTQRGHGDSARPAGGYTMRDFAADALAALDRLEIRRATMVGHSMGSLVVQRLAIDRPERVARLVLIGAGANARNDATTALRADVEALPDPVPEAFVREFQESTAYEPLPRDFLDRVVAESRKLPARLWRTVLDGILEFDGTPELAAVRCPTLILWGEGDGIFGRAEEERLRDGIAGAELRVYEKTGHSPNWECPETVVRDLLAFVAAHPAGR